MWGGGWGGGEKEEVRGICSRAIRLAVAVNDKSIDVQTISGGINGISRETDKNQCALGVRRLYGNMTRVCVR